MEKPSLSIPTIETVDGKSSVKFVDKTYPEFIKDNTQTNLRSVDLGDGNYSYTVQRNIIFDTPKIESAKSQEVPKAVNVNVAKPTSDIESKKAEIDMIENNLFVHGTDDGYTVRSGENGIMEAYAYDNAKDLRSKFDVNIKPGIKMHIEFTNKDGVTIYNSLITATDTKRGAGLGFLAVSIGNDIAKTLSKPEIYKILDNKLNEASGQVIFENKFYEKNSGIHLKNIVFKPKEESEIEAIQAKPQQQRRGNGKSIERNKKLSDEDLMPNFSEAIEQPTGFEAKKKSTNLQMDFITYAKSQSPEIKRSLIAMNRNKEIEVKCK
jgi:hypothetical protein